MIYWNDVFITFQLHVWLYFSCLTVWKEVMKWKTLWINFFDFRCGGAKDAYGAFIPNQSAYCTYINMLFLKKITDDLFASFLCSLKHFCSFYIDFMYKLVEKNVDGTWKLNFHSVLINANGELLRVRGLFIIVPPLLISSWLPIRFPSREDCIICWKAWPLKCSIRFHFVSSLSVMFAKLVGLW